MAWITLVHHDPSDISPTNVEFVVSGPRKTLLYFIVSAACKTPYQPRGKSYGDAGRLDLTNSSERLFRKCMDVDVRWAWGPGLNRVRGYPSTPTLHHKRHVSVVHQRYLNDPLQEEEVE